MPKPAGAAAEGGGGPSPAGVGGSGPLAAGAGAGAGGLGFDGLYGQHDAGVAGRPVGELGDSLVLGSQLGKPNAQTKWTVLIYGHADHNLSRSFARDLVEMARATVSEQVNVIVLADWDASQEQAGGAHFPTGASWVRVLGGGEIEPLAAESELNLDEPAVLTATVAATFQHFPSDRRALILWDHGASWSQGFGCDSQDGTLDPCRQLKVDEAVQAIEEGLERCGVKGLEILAFDTCLMAGAEIAWAVKDLAEVYIADAEIDYGDGWDYEAFFSSLSANLDATPRELARGEVEQWDRHHRGATFSDDLLRSHVALDLRVLDAVGEALTSFVEDWQSSPSAGAAALARASYFSLPPYKNQLEDPQSEPELRDIGQFLDRVSKVTDPTLAASAKRAREALQSAIIASSQGELRERVDQLGLHVELPLPAAINPMLLQSYRGETKRWLAASHWDEALDAYHDLADTREPTIVARIDDAANPAGNSSPTVTFSVPDADVAEAGVYLAQLTSDASGLVFFGVVAKSPLDAGASYQFAWDRQLATITDSQGKAQPVDVGVWEDTGLDASGVQSSLLAIYGVLSARDGQHLAALLFRDGSAETSLLTLLDAPFTLSLAQVAEDLRGSSFTPLYQTVSLETGEQDALFGEPIALDRPSLELGHANAPPARYALVTVASDVYGNTAYDVQLAELNAQQP